MFLAQMKKNQPLNIHISATSSRIIFLSKNIVTKIKKNWFELQISAVHDLSELLCLKTVQRDKYRYVLDCKSNLY